MRFNALIGKIDENKKVPVPEKKGTGAGENGSYKSAIPASSQARTTSSGQMEL